MSNINRQENFNDGDNHKPPELLNTEFSAGILKSMDAALDEMLSMKNLTPGCDEFYNLFRNFLDMYEKYQQEVLQASGINIVCRAGCSACCFHWVDDVYSFEGYVIARYLKDNYNWKIKSLIEKFRNDAEIFESLYGIVNEKTDGYSGSCDEVADPYDMVLSSFYQLGRPCALLDDQGRCIVYPVRPFTCRDYLNIKNPEACLPERINNDARATIIMYLSDDISEKFEQLHHRYNKNGDDMSLRKLLVFFLEN